MHTIKTIATLSLATALLYSCKDNAIDPIIVPPPSEGNTMTLNGILGAEPGSSAGNVVYVDLSTATQTPVARTAWDLGFAATNAYKVILNNSTSAGALVTNKSNLSDITAQDTIGLTLAVSQANPSVADFQYFDSLDGSLNTTVIPSISAIDNDNKVIILNRGTGGGIPARPWLKLKINRNAMGGYTVQYGTITQQNEFKTITLAKDPAYNFNYLSLTSGTTVPVEPTKENWDFVWGYSVYKTFFGTEAVAYNFSDLVFTNLHQNIQVAEVVATESNQLSYNNFTHADLNHPSIIFSNKRDAIGANWRSTTGSAIGVKTDRFYLIKDNNNNVYKLKFNSFISNDGGTRGKPVIQYALVKKG